MTGAKTEAVKVVRDRAELAARILAKWGPERVREAEARLCSVCRRGPGNCSLVPITTAGEDCSYYDRTRSR